MKENYQQHRNRKYILFHKTTTAILAVAVLLLTLKLYNVNGANVYSSEEMHRLQGQNDEIQERNQEIQEQNREMQEQNQEMLEQTHKMQEEIDALSTETAFSRLTVKGTLLYDELNNPVVLRGMSSHGIAWYPEYTNYQALRTLKDYGANVFRIAMYVDQNDGYLEEPELNKKLMYTAIENSQAAGLYTIVDWHVLRDENPNKNIEQALLVFEEIAKRYGDAPGILYEICNEPNGDTDYAEIKKYADQVIPVIRKYAPHAVILVGTPKFCTSLTGAIEDPIEYPNIMYTYHYYAGISDCQFAMEEISRGLEQGLPVFISEWGLDGYEVTEEHREETKSFLDFLEQKQISWVNWSFSNKDEGYSMIAPDSDKLYGWTQEELTDTGRFVLSYLSRADR